MSGVEQGVFPRDEVAFRRVVNKPTRGVGAATIDRVVGMASLGPDADGDLAAAARRVMPDLPAKARSGLAAFLTAVAAGSAAIQWDEAPPSVAAVPNDPAGTETSVSALLPDALAVSESPAGALLPTEPGATDSPVKKTGRAGKRESSRKRDGLSAGEGLSVCVVSLIVEAGIAEYHISHDEIAGNQRIANLQELANAASLYPAARTGLLEFLEHIELDRAMEAPKQEGASDDVVTLITLHNTKGLEFRRVIMSGVEQGVFPRDDKQDDDLEEERRLFYVGATRAMDELYLCSCAMRRMFGRTTPMEPSIFLREVDRSSLRVIGNAPYGFTPSARNGKDKGVVHAALPGASGRTSAGKAGLAVGSGKNSGTSPGQIPGAFSSDGRWRVGERVFHDDHGYGAVAEIRESEDGPVIRVRFETGGEVRFLSSHQSSRFTKIGED
jgi:DNA helicase-2/ATP-dependent DNA helicase PcrA